MTLNADTVKPA